MRDHKTRRKPNGNKYVLKNARVFERIGNPEIVMNAFESLDPRDLRMICFDGLRITVLLRDHSEVVFEYPNREQMEAAIEYWANPKKRFLLEAMPE